MPYAYSVAAKENEAKAVGTSLPISYKFSIEICTEIRGKTLSQAKKFLEGVIALKQPAPMRRFNRDLGHKPGMASGRYPQKCCKHILSLLQSAEANAQFKGLSTANLVIQHISAQQGPNTWRMGRKRRRRAKRTHVEIVLAESKNAGEQKQRRRAAKTPATKPQPAGTPQRTEQKTASESARSQEHTKPQTPSPKPLTP